MHITVRVKKYHQIMSDGSIITTIPEDPMRPASIKNMSTQIYISNSIEEAQNMKPQYVSEMSFFKRLWYRIKKAYRYALEYIKNSINNYIQKVRRN